MTPISDGGSILIVEDEPIILMLVVDHLSDLGYSTIEARDAATALPLLEGDDTIDLMLTDVGLPDMNGRDLAERARELRPNLKILFATGYSEDVQSWPGFPGHGQGFVGKPFDMDELADKVCTLITL